MIAGQQVKYVWNYNETADFSQLAYHKMMLWNDGICILGCNEDNRIIFVKLLGFEAGISGNDFKSLLLDEPVLGGGEPVTQILVLSERNMLIPSELFDAVQSEIWFKSVHFVAENEQIVTSTGTGESGIVILDAVRSDLINAVKDIYSDVKIQEGSHCLMNFWDKNAYNVSITVIGDKALIQAYHQSKLHAFQMIEGTEAAVLYYLTIFSEKNNIGQSEIKVIINGCGDRIVPIITLLGDFFAVGTSWVNESFFDKIEQCVS